jgi:hypothetical protein
MNSAWNVALVAFGAVFAVTAFLSAFTLSKSKTESSLEGYLLASGGLRRAAIVNLLLSSSFGLNALFYGVWLGYSIGIWALIIQFSWSVSYYLLAPFTQKIQQHKSLHQLIGDRFCIYTQVIASIASLIGIMYFIGWEVNIAKSTLGGLLATTGDLSVTDSAAAGSWLAAALVFGCLLYTVLGGLRGNASADALLNTIKVLVLILLTFTLIQRTFSEGNGSYTAHLFPSFQVVLANLGWMGLATNIIFNLAWQFVDTSSWQSIIGGAKEKKDDEATTLKISGVWIFFIPGVLATLLGASLKGESGVTQENLFVKCFEMAPAFSGVTLFMLFLTTSACVMSLIDGYFLAAAYTFLIDIFNPSVTIEELDSDGPRAEKMLLGARVALVGIGLISVWGVDFILNALGLKLFDFVYVVILTQLALIGPVLFALATVRRPILPGWLAIVISLVVGFGFTIAGAVYELKWAIDGAGVFAVLSSLAVTFFTTSNIVEEIE